MDATVLSRIARYATNGGIGMCNSFEKDSDGLSLGCDTGAAKIHINIVHLKTICDSRLFYAIGNDIVARMPYFPTPPVGLNGTEISVAILSSRGYSFNPHTFLWPGVHHEFYLKFWQQFETRCTSDPRYRSLTPVVNGRSPSGYAAEFRLRTETFEPDDTYDCTEYDYGCAATRNSSVPGDDASVTMVSGTVVSESHIVDDFDIIDSLSIPRYRSERRPT